MITISGIFCIDICITIKHILKKNIIYWLFKMYSMFIIFVIYLFFCAILGKADECL